MHLKNRVQAYEILTLVLPNGANAEFCSGMIAFMKRILLAANPLALVAGLWIFVEQNRARFPDPVAIHWGISGAPDGFASLDSQLVLTTATLALLGILWASVVFLTRIPKTVRILFLAVVGSVWLLLFFLFAYTFAIQLDLSDSRQAELSIFVLAAILLFPLLLLPWVFAKPNIEVRERLWVRYWGVPLLNLDISEIQSATVGEVRASDFGGWGIRYANRTTAFMPSSGQALDLTLGAGERILIRTDRADELIRQIEDARGSR